MIAATRFIAVVTGLLMCGLVALGGNAVAAPYVHAASCAVSDGTPDIGGTVGVTGHDFGANDSVSITLQPGAINLASTSSNASGDVSTTVSLPANVAGTHTLVLLDAATSQSATCSINIGGSGTGGESSGGSSGGGLSATGVAVASILVVGLGLLVGGAVLLVSGRRRKARV